MPLTAETFAALVLEDTDGRWELHRYRLREKPLMSFGHNQAAYEIVRQLMQQLTSTEYLVRMNSGHLSAGPGFSYVPDVAVVPNELTLEFRDSPRLFETYDAPILFVVEVWSPSTGFYDIDQKIPVYRERGDAEIWRVHPFERTVTIWRRQPDGEYVERTETSGVVDLLAIQGVQIDLDRLFASI